MDIVNSITEQELENREIYLLAMLKRKALTDNKITLNEALEEVIEDMKLLEDVGVEIEIKKNNKQNDKNKQEPDSVFTDADFDNIFK